MSKTVIWPPALGGKPLVLEFFVDETNDLLVDETGDSFVFVEE